MLIQPYAHYDATDDWDTLKPGELFRIVESDDPYGVWMKIESNGVFPSPPPMAVNIATGSATRMGGPCRVARVEGVFREWANLKPRA